MINGKWKKLSKWQQRLIVFVLLTIFIIIDISFVVNGFQGKKTYPIRVKHIKSITLKETDPSTLLKTLDYDTIQ